MGPEEMDPECGNNDNASMVIGLSVLIGANALSLLSLWAHRALSAGASSAGRVWRLL